MKRKSKINALCSSLILLSTIIVLYLIFCMFNIYCIANSVINSDSGSFANSYKLSRLNLLRRPLLINHLPNLLGDKSYIILLQNNTEIRPSGGFMGSYARLNFKDNVISDWYIQDIYIPDGQLRGRIDPPPPLDQAFWTGDWKLRNSNWELDFIQAAQDILWFYQKGGETGIDGVIAINLGLIQKWLEYIGPINPLDYPETLNSQNFYTTAQHYSEDYFFPGSHQKASYLASVGKTLLQTTLNSGTFTKLKLANLLYQELQAKQILVYLKDPQLSQLISDLDWDGSLGSYKLDYLYLVESNLGANKANCCIERSLDHQITINGQILETLKISWRNNNTSSIAQPPLSWGGDYINYQRIVLPQSADILELTVNDLAYQKKSEQAGDKILSINQDKTYSFDEQGRFKILGFWVTVPAQKTTYANLTYSLEKPEQIDNYQILVKRQPGIYGLPYRLTVNKELITNQTLPKDREFVVKY